MEFGRFQQDHRHSYESKRPPNPGWVLQESHEEPKKYQIAAEFVHSLETNILSLQKEKQVSQM